MIVNFNFVGFWTVGCRYGMSSRIRGLVYLFIDQFLVYIVILPTLELCFIWAKFLNDYLC